MAKYLILLFFIAIFISLELGFFCGFTIFGGTVNLVVLILVSSFFLGIEREGLIIALSISLFYDFYLFSFFGLSAMAIMIIYFVLSFYKNRLSPDSSYLVVLVLVFFSSIFFDLLVLGGLSLSAHLDFSYIFLYAILPNAMINIIIALPFFILWRKTISILKLYRIINTQEKKIIVGF